MEEFGRIKIFFLSLKIRHISKAPNIIAEKLTRGYQEFLFCYQILSFMLLVIVVKKMLSSYEGKVIMVKKIHVQ